MKGKVYLILGASYEVGDDGWEGRCLSKSLLPPTDNQWARAFIGCGKGLYEEITIISDSHLEIGHPRSDQHHLDCFECS